mmetsp:Transcript_66057/g.176836  ORF Transcript_66057/g.176836 Transcript_66057/m.176836 type:complete len:364 (+) Transcript_66057:2-1093(+)
MARIAAALQRQQSSPSEPPPAAWPAPGFLTGQPPPREPPPREAPPKEATPPPAPAADPIPSASEMAPWLDARVPCSLCHRASPSGEAHGVVCYRRRKGGAEGGCSQGVCWECMESRPRSELGMVRTTRDELESLGKQGWWMHERCMDPADLRAYFGSEKDVALARAAADQADAAQLHGGASQAAGSSAAPAVVDPIEAVRTRLRGMSVKELKAYLELHRVDFSGLVEKSELLARALELASKAPPAPKGPAWMPVGMVCRLCTKPVKQELAGVICRRCRPDGRVAGCGDGICWRCMKRAPKDSFGQVRTTKEEFQSLKQDAWWMHEACFEEGDYKDYFGESEPEEEEQARGIKVDDDGPAWANT